MITITNAALARNMRAQGVDDDTIQQILAARARLQAKDNADTETQSMSGNDAVSQINASLNQIGERIKSYRDSTDERLNGMQANLQSLEQAVAKAQIEGFVPHSASLISIGTQARGELAQNAAFNEAAETVARGMSPGKFAARVNLETGIRAAITTDGLGQTGDTSLPSAPERRAGLVVVPSRPLRILDVLPSRRVGSDSVEFIQLNSTGDAAEQLKEGDEKAEVDFEGSLQRVNIVTIAAHTTASTQILSDQSALAQQIDTLLRYKVLARLEHQLVNGPGGSGRINGLLNQATVITPAIGTTPADRVGEVLVTMATEGYSPSVILMNPLDWFRIQLTRKNAEDDEYVFGSPTMPVPPSLWNSQVVPTQTLAEGTAMVLDTSFVNILDRWQARVSVATEHKDYFTRNLVAILAELRAGLEVLDVKAVRKFELATDEEP